MSGLPGPWPASGEQPTGTLTVELYVGGTWVDITSLVYERAKVTITRGQSDEAAQVDRSTCRLTLNNRDGKFSPRNPTSPYYGLIGRNTPVRVSVQSGLAKSYRFWGEVTAWPPRWDTSGNDVWVEIEGRGVLRRLSQGNSPLSSTLYRGLVTLTDNPPVAYWPCEDAAGATVLASGLDGGQPMAVDGTPTLATSEDFVCSKPLPLLASSTWSGAVPTYTSAVAGGNQVRFLLRIPAAGTTTGTVVCRVTMTGTARRWELVYTTAAAGTLTLKIYDPDGTEIVSDGVGGWDGSLRRMTIQSLIANVIFTSWTWGSTDATTGVGVTYTGSVAGYSPGHVTRVEINPDGGMDDVTVGHISVHAGITDITDLSDELRAYDGETAGRRIERLCGEEGLVFQSIGDLDDTAAMGTQGVATLLDLVREAAAADLGPLYETVSALGLGYRARTSLYNQDAGLALDYAAGHLFGELLPVDDDLTTRNDVTVTRVGGSSARAELTTGALSVLPPPNGVGRYTEETTLSLETDAVLQDQAGWRLHQGTVDEARYPQITVHLGRQVVTESTTLRIDTLGLRPGDRVTITGLPAWLPPDDATQVVIGWSEQIDKFEHIITLNCTPESPWHVAVEGDATYGRADTDGSELADGVTSTATSLSVTVTDGPLWTTDAAEVPFDVRVGGEVMTATAITGSVEDAFGRSVSDGWGDADVGGSWTNSGGAAANFDVTGSAGTHTLTSVANPHFSAITAPHADFDIYVDVATDQLATGGPIEAGPMGRFTSANNLYQARLSFATSQVITLQIVEVVGGAGAVLDSFTTSLTHVAATFYRIRFQGIGSALRAKAWATTDAEPPWQLNIIDASLAAAGSVGCRSRLDGANTNVNPVVSWDNFQLLTPQVFTVTRSVNGVVKTHSAGADVRLAYPVVAAL
jgi:hypothetical protein